MKKSNRKPKRKLKPKRRRQRRRQPQLNSNSKADDAPVQADQLSDSQSHQVYVVSLNDPHAQPHLVTPDYVVRQGDFFMHDSDDVERACRGKLDELRRLQEPARLQRIRDELRSLGDYRDAMHSLEIADEDRMYLNAWLSSSASMRSEPTVHLPAKALLPELVAAYEAALAHGKQTPRVMRIARDLLKSVASGLYIASYFRAFDRQHGFSGTYQD